MRWTHSLQFPSATSQETTPAVEHSVVLATGYTALLPSHICYRDRLFTYPLSLTNALKHLGPMDAALSGLGYLSTHFNSHLGPKKPVETAEDWLLSRFGRHLYDIFVSDYCRKIWGVSARSLTSEYAAHSLPSKLSLADLTASTDLSAPTAVKVAADQLRYRSSIVVSLLIEPAIEAISLFPQHMYVHSPAVAVSYIQSYGGWNTSPNSRGIHLGLSYLCDQTDSLWQLSDKMLIAQAIRELRALRLIVDSSVCHPASDAVIRQERAYLVQTTDTSAQLATVRTYLNRVKQSGT